MKQIQTTKFDKLPVNPHVKPVRMQDGLYPQDPEENEAYWDFINWYMAQEHILLLNIPKTDCKNDFWKKDINECGDDVSAFNTRDYERLHPYSLDVDQYKCGKIFEKVKDLALLHRSIGDQEGKKNIRNRYIHLVEKHFRDKALSLVENHWSQPLSLNKDDLKRQVTALNSKIRKCKAIWEENAYWL